MPERYAIFRPLEPPATLEPELGGAAPALRRTKSGVTAPEAIAKLAHPRTRDQLEFAMLDAPPTPEAGALVMRASQMPMRLITHDVGAEGGPGSAWGLEAVGALEASAKGLSGAGVCVAVLDSGIEADHPAFKGLITTDNYRDFTGTDLQDRVGHGTHCAGIIFGRDVNGTRIGVAPGVERVRIAKVVDTQGLTNSAVLEEALLWALDGGANVISISLGLDFLAHAAALEQRMPEDAATAVALADYRDYAAYFDLVMQRVVSAPALGATALVVAAAGNGSAADATPPYRVPATLPATANHVLSVGALDRAEASLRVAPFSNDRVDVCAPGVDILSADLGGGLRTRTGTSQAAPHVAGVAALWYEQLTRQAYTPPTPTRLREKLLGQGDWSAITPRPTPEEAGVGLARAPR